MSKQYLTQKPDLLGQVDNNKLFAASDYPFPMQKATPPPVITRIEEKDESDEIEKAKSAQYLRSWRPPYED